MSDYQKLTDFISDFLDTSGISFAYQDAKQYLQMKFNNPVELQIKFIEDLNKWHKDGSNILEALREIRNSAVRRGVKNSFNERAADSIITSMQNGKTVAEGMIGNFNDEIISLFTIGEKTNTVVELTNEYLINANTQNDIKKGSLKKLLYPFIMTLVCISIMVAINDYGVPMLNEMGLHVERLKGDSKKLLDYSSIVSTIWGPFSVILTASWLFYVITKNTYTGKVRWIPSRRMLDKIPPYSIHKQLTAMKLIKQISMLSRSGLALKDTVETISQNATAYEKYYLNKVKILLGNNTGTIATYLNVNLLSEDLFQRLSSLAKQEGENAKMNAIFVAGERSGEAAQDEIKRALKYLVPAVWLLMIFLVMTLILGVISFQGSAKNLI
ncbi:MAG: hypothetical protein P8I03_16740 [Thalassotalea sp.]|nr:hypothetical protein [Thalassotalea sp.]